MWVRVDEGMNQPVGDARRDENRQKEQDQHRCPRWAAVVLWLLSIHWFSIQYLLHSLPEASEPGWNGGSHESMKAIL